MSGDDVICNSSSNPHIREVLERRLTRRDLLRGGLSATALSFAGGGSALLSACATTEAGYAAATTRPAALGFKAVPKGKADSVIVAEGYSTKVLLRLGDPIAAAVPAYANNGTDAAASFAQRAGDHHDGMHYFGLGARRKLFGQTPSERGLLVMNHEAITPLFLHPTGQTIVPARARCR